MKLSLKENTFYLILNLLFFYKKLGLITTLKMIRYINNKVLLIKTLFKSVNKLKWKVLIYETEGNRKHACCLCGPERHFPHARARRSKISSDSKSGGEYVAFFCGVFFFLEFFIAYTHYFMKDYKNSANMLTSNYIQNLRKCLLKNW